MTTNVRGNTSSIHQAIPVPSSKTTRKKRVLPYPTSIEIYNVFPNVPSHIHEQISEKDLSDIASPLEAGTTSLFRRRKNHRFEYTTKLLQSVQMQITVTCTDNNNTAEEKVVYTSSKSKQQVSCVQPHFHHLQDPIVKMIESLSYDRSCHHYHHQQHNDNDDYDKQEKLYESIKAKLYVQLVDSCPDDRWHSTNNSTTTNDMQSSSKQEHEANYIQPTIYNFLEMYIHPNRLCRIPSNYIVGNNSSNTNSNSSNQNKIVLDQLPINFVLIYFSDHTIRIHPSHYQLLNTLYQFHPIISNLSSTHPNQTISSPSSSPTRLISSNDSSIHSTKATITTTTSYSPATSTIQQQKNKNTMSSSSSSSMNKMTNSSFFDDDIFHTLDGATPATDTTNYMSQTNHDDHIIIKEDATNTVITNGHFKNSIVDKNQNQEGNLLLSYETSSANDESFRLQQDDDDVEVETSYRAHIPLYHDDSRGNIEVVDRETLVQMNRFKELMVHSIIRNTESIQVDDMNSTMKHSLVHVKPACELELLRSFVDNELAMLMQEKDKLQSRVREVKCLVQKINTVTEQNERIEKEIQNKYLHVPLRNKFIIEGQKIRHVRELQRIYPITMVMKHRVVGPPGNGATINNAENSGKVVDHYYIRGLEIPHDLYSGTVSEETISAAFGYLCHVTFLLCKYLAIHIRYRLHCQSSRSAIPDPITGLTYPLFPNGRQVEREQFEYGVHLLHRTIDCICTARAITIQSSSSSDHGNAHILAKVLRIYENVCDGY